MSMLRTAALRPLRTAQPSLRRTLATEQHEEPINKQRGNSKTPFYIAGVLGVFLGGYLIAGKTGVESTASKSVEAAASKNISKAEKIASGKQ